MEIRQGLKIAIIFCYNQFATIILKIVPDMISKDHSIFHCYVAVIASIKDLLKLMCDVRDGNFSANFWVKLGPTNDQIFTV